MNKSCSLCNRKASRAMAVKRCPHCSEFFCHSCLLTVHKPSLSASKRSSDDASSIANELRRRPGSSLVRKNDDDDDKEDLMPMSGALAFEKMPRRGIYFRGLVVLFWMMIALNLYLIWTALDVDLATVTIASWLISADPPLTLEHDHYNPMAALLSFGLIGGFLACTILMELSQADLLISDSVDQDSFRAWEVGALYTRPYLLQLTASITALPPKSPSQPRASSSSPPSSSFLASSSSPVPSASGSSSPSASSLLASSSSSSSPNIAAVPGSPSLLPESGSFWSLPSSAPKSVPFNVWIGETTPRMPDGDDLETMSLVDIRRFVMKGPSGLALQFDECAPLYQWTSLTIDEETEDGGGASSQQLMLREVITIPNGVWWIGVANRSETHRINVNIHMRPVWTSPQSWVLPFEGREYACEIEATK